VLVGWFITLFTAQLPEGFHNFLTRYVRYGTHVGAYLLVAGGPFPGFAGAPGSYPIDVDVDPRARQNRWKTGFRLVLAVPAAAVSGAVGTAAFLAAIFSWWVALITGRMPRNLRQSILFSLRYSAQLNSYALLLTDRYPFASPAPPAASAAPPAVSPAVPVAE